MTHLHAERVERLRALQGNATGIILDMNGEFRHDVSLRDAVVRPAQGHTLDCFLHKDDIDKPPMLEPQLNCRSNHKEASPLMQGY